MTQKTRFRFVGHVVKLFMIGSIMATRTASGAATPEDALQHELAWMSVRDGLSGAETGIQLPADVRRLVEQGFDSDLDYRVRATYSAIAPADIAQLDALWMDRFAEGGAGTEVVDRFLQERAAALPQLVQDKADQMDSADKWRSFIREFKRAPYSGG